MADPKYRRASRIIEPKRRKALALVIEDDEELNDAICDALSEGDFECIQALSAEEGMEFLKGDERPSIIVVESMLSGTNGFQVGAYAKLRAETNAVPVLMLLDRPLEKLRLEGVRIEPDRYLLRPVEAADLLAAAKQVLSDVRKRKHDSIEFYIELCLQSDVKLLDNVNTVLSRALKVFEADEIDDQKIKYATLEMGHNAIEWGNKSDPSRRVTIEICVQKDAFSARIRDEGEGFDTSHLPHAAQPEDPVAHLEVREKMGLREGGFGILLAREFMDEVRYNEQGNEVLLVKRFRAKDASARVSPPALGG